MPLPDPLSPMPCDRVPDPTTLTFSILYQLPILPLTLIRNPDLRSCPPPLTCPPPPDLPPP
jgi:hypothetical protein